MTPCKIVLNMKLLSLGCSRLRVEMDGFTQGNLTAGTTMEIPVVPGKHMLEFYFRKKHLKSCLIDVTEQSPIATLTIRSTLLNGIQIKREQPYLWADLG